MNWQTWIKQTLPRTEIMRGGATVWPTNASGLIGDQLGPVMHLHDSATEVFYFVAGKCRMEVGDREEFYGPGDFVHVPPRVAHNLWNAGDEDLLIFWLVAPHFFENKWRTEELTAEEMQGLVVASRVEGQGKELPGDQNISSSYRIISNGERLEQKNGEKQETVLYITAGPVRVQIGKLSGELQANDFIHVPASTSFSASPSEGSAALLVFTSPGA
jgi:mannose-6-phosphate isomerase-like protein (cupin superfamily)